MDAEAGDRAAVHAQLFRQRVAAAARAIEEHESPADLVAAMQRDGIAREQAIAAVSQAIHAVAGAHMLRSGIMIGLAIGASVAAAILASIGLVRGFDGWGWWALIGQLALISGRLMISGSIGAWPRWNPRYRRVLRQARSIEWSHIET
jgi:hypothetical protein